LRGDLTQTRDFCAKPEAGDAPSFHSISNCSDCGLYGMYPPACMRWFIPRPPARSALRAAAPPPQLHCSPQKTTNLAPSALEPTFSDRTTHHATTWILHDWTPLVHRFMTGTPTCMTGGPLFMTGTPPLAPLPPLVATEGSAAGASSMALRVGYSRGDGSGRRGEASGSGIPRVRISLSSTATDPVETPLVLVPCALGPAVGCPAVGCPAVGCPAEGGGARAVGCPAVGCPAVG